MRTILTAILTAMMMSIVLVSCAAPGDVEPGPPATGQPGPTSASLGPDGCPASIDWIAQARVTTIPAGATSVRLCDLATTGPVAAPTDLLVTGVDRLAGQFNRAAPIPADQACTSDAGPSYAMVFGYPAGRTVTVASMMAGCRTVGGKTGGVELLAAFSTLLAAQRLADPPPDRRLENPCRFLFGSWIQPDPSDLVTITRCHGTGDQVRSGTAATAAQWAVLKADLAVHSRKATDTDPYPADPVLLVAQDRLGQTITFEWDGRYLGYFVGRVPARTAVRYLWTPSARALEVLLAVR